jgi:hypothetical protein
MDQRTNRYVMLATRALFTHKQQQPVVLTEKPDLR